MQTTATYVYGTGSQAIEISSLVNSASGTKPLLTISSSVSHSSTDQIINSEDISKDSSVYLAIGSPYYRKQEVIRNKSIQFKKLILSKGLEGLKDLSIGEGSVILSGTTITSKVTIGDYSLVNIGCNISHDVKIGNYVTISPGVNIAGNCKIEDGAFIGIGSTIVNDITVAKGAVLGAGSTLINNADVQNGVYVGCPAKLVKTNDTWLKSI